MNFAGYGTDHRGFGRCKFHGGATPTHMVSAIAEAAKRRSSAYGDPVVVSAMAALIAEVHRTAGHVEWLRQELDEHPDPTDFEARVLLRHYQSERSHLVKVSKAALDCGVAEREVRIAEDQGRVLVGVIQAVLASLSLTPRQLIEARRLVAAELRRVTEE